MFECSIDIQLSPGTKRKRKKKKKDYRNIRTDQKYYFETNSKLHV